LEEVYLIKSTYSTTGSSTAILAFLKYSVTTPAASHSTATLWFTTRLPGRVEGIAALEYSRFRTQPDTRA